MHAERSSEPKRPRARAIVTVEQRPAASTWPLLWEIYHEAFAPLQELALLNHLYPRASFDELLGDERISKLIAWADGRPVGLAMITNELELVPQISPPFLHRQYPAEAARNAVFFGIMVFVVDDYRRSTAFPRLIAGMGEITAEAAGVVVFDVCRHNLATVELDRQIEAMTRWFPGATFEQVDEQKYFSVTVPVRPAKMPISSLRDQPTARPSSDDAAERRLSAVVAGS